MTHCWRWLLVILFVCDAVMLLSYFTALSAHFLYASFSSLLIIPTPTPHLFTSYYKVNVEHSLAVALLAIWCSVCVCGFVLVFLDVDSRLEWTAHKQDCSVSVDLEGIYTAALCSVRIPRSILILIHLILHVISDTEPWLCAALFDCCFACICIQCESQCSGFDFSKI